MVNMPAKSKWDMTADTIIIISNLGALYILIPVGNFYYYRYPFETIKISTTNVTYVTVM